jgi:hypothetical protein
MIERIESRGYYLDECGLAGERKCDEVVPAQHNTLQVSRNRWLIVYETRGFRGVDDNRSIVYQLRKSTPFGSKLSEGYLDKSINDWSSSDQR